MTNYRIQVCVVLKTGSTSIMAYGFEGENHHRPCIEARKLAKADPDVRRVESVTWEAE